MNKTHALIQHSKPSTPTTLSAEEQKAARQAKMEQWKRKRAEEQAKKEKDLDAAGATRNILNEIDKKAGLTPAITSASNTHDARYPVSSR